MIPKERKIGRALFPVGRTGKRYQGRMLNLKVVEAPHVAHAPRFAVVVSRKVAKKAVTRNRIKRRVYASIAGVLDAVTAPVLCVFYVRKEVREGDFHDIDADVRALLHKAGLL